MSQVAAAPVVISRRSAANARSREQASSSRAVATNAKNSAFASLFALPAGKIASYGFSYFSSDQILAMSVMEITIPNGGTVGNLGTSTDPRLGAVRKSEICVKCSLPSLYDNGHYGHIDLHCHLINPIDECKKTVILVFKCLCNGCGKPIVPAVEAERIFASTKNFMEKLTDLADRAESSPCNRRGIGNAQCGGTAFILDLKSAATPGFLGKMPLDRAYDILKELTDEDLRDIGFRSAPGPISHIMRVFPVIPHRNRMAARTNYGTLGNSVMTKQYDEILVQAGVVQNASEANKKAEIAKLSGKIEDLYLKAYKKTLTDKEHGIIRNKMDGKTITCSSRTVIVPEPKYPVTHGTIPKMLAKASTIRETVTEKNIELFKKLMIEGKIKVIFPGNSQIDSKVEVEKGKIYTLNIGDKIDREILDGDKSIFDRPPTLHEAGVVPVTIVIDDSAHFSFYESDEEKNENIFIEIIRNQEGYVVGLHLGLTVAKAADFDGDEDSVVYPQHEDSRAEMDGIQHIENYLIDGQGQKVAFAPVQDALLGCYVATKYSLPVNWRANHKRKYTADDLLTSVQLMETYTYISKERFVDFARMLDDPLVERKQPYISKVVDETLVQGRVNISDETGEIEFSGPFIDSLKENGLDFVVDGVIPAVHLLSFILPDNMTFKNKSVTINNGIVVECKSVSSKEIGNEQLGLIAHMTFNHTRAEAVNFITDSTWIFTSFISFRGFSIGMGDNLPPTPEIQKKLDRIVVRMYERLEYVKEPSTDDRIERRRYENAYNSATEDATNGSRLAVDATISPSNGLLTIIESGAKGKKEQLYNLVATGGQKYESGSKPKKVLTNGTRRCVYFHAEDTDPDSHGYVSKSYSQGVNPVQSDFIQKNTRSDFIVMSQDTPIVGQASREICTVNIGIVVGKEGELRDSVGVISPSFAGDNFNPMRLTRVLRPNGSKQLSIIDVAALAQEFMHRSTRML